MTDVHDWGGHPFPYALELHRMCHSARDVLRLWLHLVRVGSLLARTQEAWPEGASAAMVRIGTELEKLRAHIEAAEEDSDVFSAQTDS